MTHTAYLLLFLVTETTPKVELSRALALQRAIESNPQISAARTQVNRAQAMAGQADAARWPELTIDLATGPSLKADRKPGTDVGSTENAWGDMDLEDLSILIAGRISALQPLWTFGKIAHRRQAAEHGVRARRFEVRMTEADVALSVARLYESFLLARDAARFFEEVRHTVQRSVEETKERFEAKAADISEQDLLRLSTAERLATLGLHEARAGVAQAEAGLRAYLSLPAGSVVEVSENTLEPLTQELGALEALVQAALENRPELAALEEGAKALSRLADAEAAGLWPSLFLLAFLDTAYTPGRDRLDTRYVIDPLYHFTPGVLLGLRWNLQAGMTSERSEEKRAEAARLAELRRWALAGVPAEVTRAYEDARRAMADLGASAEGVDMSTKWAVRSSADYEAGLGDSRSITDSLQAYVQMRLGNLDSRFRLNVALAELAKATGTLELGTSPLYPGEHSR